MFQINAFCLKKSRPQSFFSMSKTPSRLINVLVYPQMSQLTVPRLDAHRCLGINIKM